MVFTAFTVNIDGLQSISQSPSPHTHTHPTHTDPQVPEHKRCQLKCNETPHAETLKITQMIISTTDIQRMRLHFLSFKPGH